MVEIFTTGGGEYIVNVLNAVAAWTGAGGYKSLIQVALVMGMALAVIVVAFNQDWRAWLNWFLGATLIYMCLMVPRMDVQVTDRVNPSLAPATVANVPLGLALMASFTSQAGDYLTRSAELVFGLPDDLNYWPGARVAGQDVQVVPQVQGEPQAVEAGTQICRGSGRHYPDGSIVLIQLPPSARCCLAPASSMSGNGIAMPRPIYITCGAQAPERDQIRSARCCASFKCSAAS